MSRIARLLWIAPLRTAVPFALGGAGVLAVAVFVAARLVGADAADARLVAGVISAVTLVVVIPLVAFLQWRPAVESMWDMAAMVAGESWAHWRYDPSEWRRANRVEARRARRAALPWVVTGLVTAAVVTGAALVIPDAGIRRDALAVGALIAVGVPVRYALSGSTSLWRRGEIHVSRHGIWRRPGGYLPFDGPTSRLLQVRLVDQPAATELRFATTRSDGALPAKARLADVAVPAGREDEARRLVERLTAEVLAPRAARPPEKPSGSGSVGSEAFNVLDVLKWD